MTKLHENTSTMHHEEEMRIYDLWQVKLKNMWRSCCQRAHRQWGRTWLCCVWATRTFISNIWFVSRRRPPVSVQGRRGLAGQHCHRHPYRHRLHHLLCSLPHVWIPSQVCIHALCTFSCSSLAHFINRVHPCLLMITFSSVQHTHSQLGLVCSLFCSKGTQDSWSPSRIQPVHTGIPKDGEALPRGESQVHALSYLMHTNNNKTHLKVLTC